MKKILFTIVLFIICPIIALGKDFAIKDYGITMSFDKNWDVFTRKSTKDDIFLLKYNLDYDLLQKNLKDNLIYLYAICEINDNSNIEFLFTTTGEKVVITEEEFEMFASLLIEKYDAENYEIYESNYEYIKYDYFNSSVDLYCVDYFLYIDSIGYFFTFRKEEPFTDDEISQVENVINSITVSGDGI